MKRNVMMRLSLVSCLGLLAISACTPQSDDTAADVPAEAPWPQWAFEHWVWEDESTQDSVMEMVNGYEERDIPVGAVIIDSPWATGYNTFEWDTTLFPDPQGMIDELHARDVRVMLWVVPAINTDVVELYAEAEAAGYFMQTSEDSGPAVVSWWKGQGSLIDYFNPEALDWWHSLIDPVLDMGIDGWKCDGLDFSAALAPYSPGAGRNIDRLEYSHAYYQDFHDYTREVLGEDRVNTARPIDNYGARLGGEAVSFAPLEINWAGWVGDQDPTWDGLVAALSNMYYSSEFGYVAFGSDIGGYREDSSLDLGREKDVFIRWAQLGAFNPVMENGGSGEHWPWRFDEETTAIYKRYATLHEALLPYLMEQGAKAWEEGVSMMQFSSMSTYEYLLGADLFVAPMLGPEGTRSVPLPEGNWIYLFDGEEHVGGATIELDVPLDEYPVFVRQGSSLEELVGWE